MEKLKEYGEWIIVILVLVILFTILGLINKNGMKRCVEAGHTEAYCREGVK